MAFLYLDVLLSKLEKIFKLNPEEANRILKLFAQEIEIVPNNGIVQIRIKKGSALPKILAKRLVAGAVCEEDYIIWVDCEVIRGCLIQL